MKRVKKIMRRKVTHRKLIIVCLGADTSSEIEFAKVFFLLILEDWVWLCSFAWVSSSFPNWGLGGVTAGLCTDASIARTKIRWCQHNNHKSLTTKIKWFAFQTDLKSTLSWTIQISFILVTLRKVKACHLKLVTPNDCSDCISLNKVQGNSFFLGSVFGLKIECVR